MCRFSYTPAPYQTLILCRFSYTLKTRENQKILKFQRLQEHLYQFLGVIRKIQKKIFSYLVAIFMCRKTLPPPRPPDSLHFQISEKNFKGIIFKYEGNGCKCKKLFLWEITYEEKCSKIEKALSKIACQHYKYVRKGVYVFLPPIPHPAGVSLAKLGRGVA